MEESDLIALKVWTPGKNGVSQGVSPSGGTQIFAGGKAITSAAYQTPNTSLKLKTACANAGILFGAAFDETAGYASNPTYAQLLRDEADLWTPANSMKDSRVWTAANTWDFAAADAFYTMAAANNKKVRGHLFLYPDHPATWQNSSTVTSANWRSLLDAHFSAIGGRYANLVGVDVINEMFIVGTSSPFPNGYKDSVWMQAAGDGDTLMSYAFTSARARVPSDIPLFYCDNATEQGADSSRQFQKNNIVSAMTRLKNAGVPIDGFNAQWHIVVSPSYQYRQDRAQHRDFLKALVDLGLIINITEIDVRMPTGGWTGSSTEFDRRAAELLAATLETYFEVVPSSQRQHISFWEMSDAYNAWKTAISGNAWGDTERPCPFDSGMNRKAMYTAALATVLGVSA